MTLQWADFPSGQQGLYGNDASFMLNGTPWVTSAAAIFEDPDPLVSGWVMMPSEARLAISSPDTKIGVAFRFWVTSLPGNIRPILEYRTTGNVAQYTLGLRPNGGIEVLKGTGTGADVLGRADFPILLANSWHHLEIIINTANGEFEVRHNGISRITGTDSSPANTPTGIVAFVSQYAGQGSNQTFRQKDIVVYNSLGSSFNTWQGSVSVRDMLPDADVTVGGWVPSEGSTAWNLLDESPPNDADYISADDAPPAAAEVTFTDLPDDTTSVRALMSIVRSLKTDGGDGNLQISLSPDGTNYDAGNNNPITTAPTYRWDISEVSPATAAAWTPIEANAVRMKIDRTV